MCLRVRCNNNITLRISKLNCDKFMSFWADDLKVESISSRFSKVVYSFHEVSVKLARQRIVS
jgi:hypothetical protein